LLWSPGVVDVAAPRIRVPPSPKATADPPKPWRRWAGRRTALRGPMRPLAGQVRDLT